MASTRYIPLRRIQRASPETDINILLMGETGVGKTTFINSFVNYLCYNTLNAALKGEMQVLIPTSFSITDPDTFESKTINIGNPDDNENSEQIGRSNTQACRSYAFEIGNRLVRLIDAPGVGDTRGVIQDEKNCEHILAYISRYEHLNAICVLLKPNEQRLNILFRFCVKELLTHLHVTAKDNLMFIFTNGRASFYRPGATAPLLKALLDEQRATWGVDIPFNIENTFTFDNESFRFLATYKNGVQFSPEETQDFSKSWNISIKEFTRLMQRIVICELHAVRDTLSLNEAKQLIRKLTRPIGEIARLIQENIQLAERYKRTLAMDTTPSRSIRMPQKNAQVIALDHPRTVCTSEKCVQVVTVDGERRVNYATKCHPHCYLRGVEQECVSHSILQQCSAMKRDTGMCRICGCNWDRHMHITYEYRTHLTYLEMNNDNSGLPSPLLRRPSTLYEPPMTFIDKRIAALRTEQAAILHVCSKLSQFLRENSITPFNDDILEYIRHFVREEQMKRNAGAENDDVIRGLENMIEEYRRDQKVFAAMFDKKAAAASGTAPSIDDVFELIGTLYALPINGLYIRQQVEGLQQHQQQMIEHREHYVDLPTTANFSTIMLQLQSVINRKTS